MAEDHGPWGKAQAEAKAQAQAQADVRPQEPQGRPIGVYIWLGLLAAAGLGLWALAAFAPDRMGASAWGDAFADFGLLALVSAGLIRLRGLSVGVVARNVSIWVAIIGVASLGYAYRNEVTAMAGRLTQELQPETAVRSAPREMVILPDAGGQYSIRGAVNGVAVRFVIDTGSSGVVLDPQDAANLGVDVNALTYHRLFSTANGQGGGADYVIKTLQVGAVSFANVPATINKAPIGESLLGMSFLNRLASVEIKDNKMTLRWKT
jgi:aspartyl protease family protein